MTEPVYDQQDADNYYLATENRNLRKALEEAQQQLIQYRAFVEHCRDHALPDCCCPELPDGTK